MKLYADTDVPIGILTQPYAVGTTADIYAWVDGYVLKLFHEGEFLATVEHESRVARSVYDAVDAGGLFSVPAVGLIIEVQGRHGILYKRVEGQNMLALLQQQQCDADTAQVFARQMAEMHAAMHTRVIISPAESTVLPLQRQRLSRRLQSAKALSPALCDAAQRLLASLSSAGEQRLCHGDLHPGNVLLPPQSNPVIVDWCDATYGDPPADVARTLLLLGVGEVSGGSIAAAPMEVKRNAFRRAYLERYCGLCLMQREQIDKWVPVIAAARLDENVPTTEQERLLSIVRTAFGKS